MTSCGPLPDAFELAGSDAVHGPGLSAPAVPSVAVELEPPDEELAPPTPPSAAVVPEVAFVAELAVLVLPPLPLDELAFVPVTPEVDVPVVSELPLLALVEGPSVLLIAPDVALLVSPEVWVVSGPPSAGSLLVGPLHALATRLQRANSELLHTRRCMVRSAPWGASCAEYRCFGEQRGSADCSSTRCEFCHPLGAGKFSCKGTVMSASSL